MSEVIQGVGLRAMLAIQGGLVATGYTSGGPLSEADLGDLFNRLGWAGQLPVEELPEFMFMGWTMAHNPYTSQDVLIAGFKHSLSRRYVHLYGGRFWRYFNTERGNYFLPLAGSELEAELARVLEGVAELRAGCEELLNG